MAKLRQVPVQALSGLQACYRKSPLLELLPATGLKGPNLLLWACPTAPLTRIFY